MDYRINSNFYCGNSKKLQNGVVIPGIGFGTAGLLNEEETVEILHTALQCGYRHIDTASQYGNEEAVGKALIRAHQYEGIGREECFITSKLANNERKDYNSSLEAFDRSLNRLEVDYIDLYLIHWPVPWKMELCYKALNEECWEALEHLYYQGKVKAIGVSNFLERHIKYLDNIAKIMPMVNQIEVHPQFQEQELINYCNDKKIIVEAWGPFRKGKILDNEILKEIAHRYQKSVAQICLRWLLQQDIIPLVKASTKEKMKSNLDIFDFSISDEDLLRIRGMDTDDCYYKNYSYERQRKY